MSDTSVTVILNANQKRHFEVFLAHLEDLLLRVETLLVPSLGGARTLSVIENDVTEDFRENAAPVLRALHQRIDELARELSLQPRRVSASRVISATLSAAAIRVEDSMSSQLRGYGEVHASVSKQLDPVLDNMAQTLNGLSAVLRRRTPKSREE